MVRVGLIGFGPAWEARYRAALERLGPRIAIRAAHAPVALLGRSIAAELDAAWCDGILATARHPEVDAVLLLDGAQFGPEAIRLAAMAGKPVFVAEPHGCTADSLLDLSRTSRELGHLLFPALARRHTPATGRLQELMATRLGRPRVARLLGGVPDDVVGDADPPSAARAELLEALDWCRYVFRGTPVRIQSEAEDGPGDETGRLNVHFAFERGDASRTERLASIAPGEPASGRVEIECERGWAVIDSPRRIEWQVNGRAVTEDLGEERSATDVMLDHFCRRVVGGLIPVADLADVCIGLRMCEAAEQSRRTRRPVLVSGEFS